MDFGELLCKIGLHKWGKTTSYRNGMSNYIDWKKTCERCGKRKTWITTRSE